MVIELSPFFDVDRDMDRLMDSLMSPLAFSNRRVAYPPLNISEDADHVYVECEVPGVAMGDIEITFTNTTLSIRGERKPAVGRYYRGERASGLFQRMVTVNAKVDPNAIKASLKDGILWITLPKAEEAKPKKIAVEA